MRPVTTVSSIEAALIRIKDAVAAGLQHNRLLRRWSEFVRERDDHRCVDCHSRRNLSAHHICRKSFLTEAQFETGNGITLCRNCHRAAHKGFNGRADLSMPMDAQGGEKLEQMERLYCILAQDAADRGILRDDFYHLSDEVLARFKLFQGFNPATPFPGSRIQQAYLIWAQTSLRTRCALAEANGIPITDQPILPGEAYLVFADESGKPTGSFIVRNPVWY